jgi:hypothetical protein
MNDDPDGCVTVIAALISIVVSSFGVFGCVLALIGGLVTMGAALMPLAVVVTFVLVVAAIVVGLRIK